MRNLVNNLLKEQEMERRVLGEKAMAECHEILIALGCEDMINENLDKKMEARLTKSLNEIETLKEKCKEVSNLKASLTKANKAKEKKDETIKDLKEEIKELKKQIKELKKQEVKVETKIETVVDTTKVDKLQELLDKEKKKYATLQRTNQTLREQNNRLKDAIADLEADLIDVEEASEPVEEVEDKPAVKEKVKEVKENKQQTKEKEDGKKVMNTGKLQKLENYKNERRDDVDFFWSDNYYVMATKKCQEITVIPKKITTKVTDEVVKSMQDELVKMGYRRERDIVSPVTISMDKGNLIGYFARTDARAGLQSFSDEDFFSGYVMDNSRTYLWSWDGKSELCATYYLDKVIAGDKNKSVTPGTARMVTKQVKEMHKDYLAEVTKVVKAREDQIAKNTAALNKKKAEMNAYKAMFDQGIEYNPAPVKAEAPEVKQEENKSRDINLDEITDITKGYLALFN